MRFKENRIKLYITLLITAFIIIFLINIKIKNIKIIGQDSIDNQYIISEIFERQIDYVSIFCFFKEKFCEHKQINFLEKYQIEWVSPISVEIIVYEKPIVGYIRYMSNNFYFDKDGYIRKISQYKDYPVPEFFGMKYNDLVLNKQISIQDKSIFNSILNITDNILKYDLQINLVEYSDNGILLYLEQIKVLLGNNDNMEIKFMVLNDIYKEIKGMSGTLDLKHARENMLDEKYIFTLNK